MSAEEVTVPAGTMLSFDAGGWAYLCSGSQRQWVKELLPAPVMKMGDGRIYSLDVEKKAAVWRKDMLMKFTDYFPKFEMQGEEQTLCAHIYQGFRLGMRVYWDTRLKARHCLSINIVSHKSVHQHAFTARPCCSSRSQTGMLHSGWQCIGAIGLLGLAALGCLQLPLG
eukprot:8339533-Lingulodinium_polyedra.AAC.1